MGAAAADGAGTVSLRVDGLRDNRSEAEREGPNNAATAADRSMERDELSTDGPELTTGTTLLVLVTTLLEAGISCVLALEGTERVM